MRSRTDYDKVGQKIDYEKVKQRLAERVLQLTPQWRKTAADVLAPLDKHLRDLRAKGWTYQQLTQELNESGVAVKVGTLRNYLTSAAKRKRGARRSGSKRAADDA